MKTMKYNPRNLVLVLVAALFSAALAVSGAFGQTGSAQLCPVPRHIQQTIQAPAAATPVLSDFPNTPCSGGYEPNFGGTTINRCFRHTFSFPPPSELCCQCVESKHNTLTITYNALQPGQPYSSSSANDTVGIYGGSVVTSPLYVPPAGGGPPWKRTKTIPLTCAMLANNRLSFLVQDDTSVLSATVDIDTCCVKK